MSDPAPSSPPPGPPRGGWTGGWVVFAAATAGLQALGFWLVSPSHPRPLGAVHPPPPRTAVLAAGPEEDATDAWLWLLSPSVFLAPSERDFSGPAWLEGTPVRVEIEAFTVPERPLPFEAAAVPPEPAPGGTGPLARLDPGPGSRWELPSGSVAPAPAAPVAFPAEGRLRLLSGFDGWQPMPRPGWPMLADAATAKPVVVRLAIGPDGAPATPPTVWETSGSGALDEAALDLASSLEWRHPGRAPVHDPGSDPGAPWAWGLVEFQWGRKPAGP